MTSGYTANATISVQQQPHRREGHFRGSKRSDQPHTHSASLSSLAPTEASGLWFPFRAGDTLGTKAPDLGTVIVDDEHASGARITLARDCGPVPFAITCGIYGLLFHTRYIPNETAARQQLDALKAGIDEILSRLPEGPLRQDALGSAGEAFASLIDQC